MPSKNINNALYSPSDIKLWANDIKYHYVFDRMYNAPRSVEEIIGYNLANVLKLREEAKTAEENLARFRCISCDCPLVLLSTSDRSGFYFKHKHYVDHCPIKDEASLPPDVLRAKKFKGNQESAAHAYMKGLLYRLLQRDKRFKQVKQEQVHKDFSSGRWKKPDVEGVFQEEKIVFEIQLATEFLDVIKSRREFYKKEKTLLVWVFQAYSFDKARISDLDIAYSNNSNVLVLDADSLKKTVETGELHFTCHWPRVHHKGNKIYYTPEVDVINFFNMIRDFQNCRIYNYDFMRRDIEAKQRVFTHLWEKASLSQHDDERTAAIIKESYGVGIKAHRHLARFIHMMWVARTGKPSGWKYIPSEVFHKLFDRYPGLAFMYFSACEAYGHKLDDKNGLITSKLMKMTENLQEDCNSVYRLDKNFIEVAQLIFPTAYNYYLNKLPQVSSTTDFGVIT